MGKAEAALAGFLDRGCSIKGDVTFSDLLRVHGHVVGKVASEHELLVGEGGVVEGEVVVGNLAVAGTVRGTVRVKERMVVHSSGRVYAEVFAPRLVVEEGGVLDGVVHMSREGALDSTGKKG